jgi:hypothetical protein
VGNGCKVAITLAGLPPSPAVDAAVVGSGLVDAATRALIATANALDADATAVSARRNAAVALAKWMRRAPEAEARIRELRGMEVLMAIGGAVA